MVSEERLADFIARYRGDYGITLERSEAIEIIARLRRLYRLVVLPVPPAQSVPDEKDTVHLPTGMDD